MLSAAAVLGTQFAVDAVIDMAGIAEGDALDALDSAEAAGLLADVPARAATLRFVQSWWPAPCTPGFRAAGGG